MTKRRGAKKLPSQPTVFDINIAVIRTLHSYLHLKDDPAELRRLVEVAIESFYEEGH